MKLRYVGPLAGPMVVVLADGRELVTGGDDTLDVADEALAASLLDQPTNWQAVAAKAHTKE